MALSCGVALAMMAGSVQAADGTVEFGGKVLAATCAYNGTGESLVKLPDVNERVLAETGKTAGARNFEMHFSDCPKGVPIRAKFLAREGYIDPEIGMLINKLETYGAKNVELALMDESGNLISVGKPQTDEPVVVDDAGKATLTYGVEYYALAPVVAGEVMGFVNFDVEYL